MIDSSILSTLRHCQVTNLAAGKISNHDAAALIIATSPGTVARSADVIKQLRQWRAGAGQPDLSFTYLWNTSKFGGYGFVGRDFYSAFNAVEHEAPRRGVRVKWTTSHRRTYWHRVKTGHYRLTLEGFRRLAELEAQLQTV
jgi:hypothetical protein